MQTPRIAQGPQLTQKTTITPRLQQALKVLNMPLQELTQLIAQELEQNPFLELDETQETPPHAEDLNIDPQGNDTQQDINTEDTTVDIDWDTAFEDRISSSERVNTTYTDTDDDSQPDLAYEQSLHEYLTEQLDLAVPRIITSETEYAIAEQILGNLNDDGQLELILFQIPSDFLPELESGTLSTELYIFIQKHLQETSYDPDVQFSRNATITAETPPALPDKPATPTWKIEDTENRKKYTVVYESHASDSRKVLNFYELTFEDIAETTGSTPGLVETVLRKIQDNFDPIGIAHRDVREALLIQIRNYGYESPTDPSENGDVSNGVPESRHRQNTPMLRLAKAVIENHYETFLHQKYDNLAEILNVDITEIHAVKKWIGRLSPYPGRRFTDPTTRSTRRSSFAQTVTPDVEIQYLNGRYQAVAVDNYVPRLHINPYYVDLMRNGQDTLDAETKKWIEKRYRQATDLLSSLAQRGSTIARVTEAIFEIQTDFLTQGVKGIKPLNLRTIAEKIGVHESTVSRVTSTKYVQTPHGLYPLRFFFSNELSTTQGDTVSAKQVKTLIQEMITAEPPTKPLSDQVISNTLKAKGIVVARRTVQKYRDELGIPTSRKRGSLNATAPRNSS